MARAAFLLLVVAALCAPQDARAEPRALKFFTDVASTGGAPDRCRPAFTQGKPSRWQVVADRDSFGGRAVTEVARDNGFNRYALCINDAYRATDVDITLRIKQLTESGDHQSGIAVRVRDPSTYYLAAINPRARKIELSFVVNANRSTIASADVPIAKGFWHVLRMRAEGDRLRVFFNGQEVISARNGMISSAGNVAIWSRSDTQAQFGDGTIDLLR